jgi:hypothetical protein
MRGSRSPGGRKEDIGKRVMFRERIKRERSVEEDREREERKNPERKKDMKNFPEDVSFNKVCRTTRVDPPR